MAGFRRDLRLGLLFLFCSVVAGMIMSGIKRTDVGFWLHGLVLWLAGYVFVSHTSFPIRTYWFLLMAIPIAWVAKNAGPLAGLLQALTAIGVGVAIVVSIVRKLRARSS